jgi:prepilin-type N-terminal cleavage/methylation domain-containing protein
MFHESKRGFTLIELLVVISIISLLSSIIFASLNSARVKARDAGRIAQLEQIRNAIELYYNDNGQYPPSPCGRDCNDYYYSDNTSSWTTFATLLAPYIKLPADPVNSPCPPWVDYCYSYAYGNVGTGNGYILGYDLVAQLEDTNSPYRCGIKNYKWTSFGSMCTAFGGGYSNYMYKANQ